MFCLRRAIEGFIICVALYSVLTYILGLSITAGVFILHVTVIPLIFKYSKTFQRTLVFANFVQWPLKVDYDDPSSRGLEGARNLSIEYESKVDQCPVKIGMWHIVPRSVYDRLKNHFDGCTDKEELNKILDEELATSKKPIMFYCHGNSNSRAATHRIILYKFFQQMDFHTIAFDYRGYGDSTNIHPSEDGVVEDALVVYDWLYSTIDKGGKLPPIYVWGHSLGTGIAAHLLGNLDELSVEVLERGNSLPLPNGLILESPFNNLADEIYAHPLSKLVTWLHWHDATFLRPFARWFRSDAHLARAPRLPVLILHARDDIVVPHLVGEQLYHSLLESRANGGAALTMHSYDARHGFGHKWICNAADLPQVVGDFVKEHQ